MQFVLPNSITCHYNAQMGSFEISWNYSKPFSGKNPGTIIAEIGESERGWIFHVESIYRIPLGNSQQQNVASKANNTEGISHFLVIGFDDIYADDLVYQLRNYAQNSNVTDSICRGLLSIGRVSWDIVAMSNDQVLLKIYSTVSIPIGFLYYSYNYLNVEFQYPVLIPILPNSNDNHITIIIPHDYGFEMNSLKLISCGTGLIVQKEKNEGIIIQKKKEGCLKKLLKKFGL